MTPQELQYMLEGHREVEAEKIDQINFQVRRICYHIVAVQQDSNSPNAVKSEIHMWPHKWDESLEKTRRNSLPISKVEYE